jgi:hypothetical protein
VFGSYARSQTDDGKGGTYYYGGYGDNPSSGAAAAPAPTPAP